MIFLIANMSEKIRLNSLKTHGGIFSNLQISGDTPTALENAVPKTGDARVPCARMMRSTKGEFVPA
ncbi:MAG TPA: hypothetical protein VEJ38_00685 [Candidatus Acidoferrales bacterium]|nr:hypothetical protein [Candidatus Acidoferrales bacterium]